MADNAVCQLKCGTRLLGVGAVADDAGLVTGKAHWVTSIESVETSSVGTREGRQ